MRKLVIHLGIVLVFAALFGIYPAFYFFQLDARMHAHKILEQTTTEGLVRIELTAENFELARVEGNELLIDGRMFDARQIERRENCVVVLGIYDDDETALIARLVNFIHHKKDDTLVDLGDFFSLQLFVDAFEVEVFDLNVSSLRMPHVVVALLLNLQPVNSPPPDTGVA